MSGLLTSFVIIIGIMVFASIINEKKLHIPNDIALLLISFFIAVSILILSKLGIIPFIDVILKTIGKVKLDGFVLECALGFIMFASASKIHLTKFVKNLLPIRCAFSNSDIYIFCSVWSTIFFDKFSLKIKHRNMDFYCFTERYLLL